VSLTAPGALRACAGPTGGAAAARGGAAVAAAMDGAEAVSGGGSDSDFESDGALAHRRSSLLGVLSRTLSRHGGGDAEAVALLEAFRKRAVSLLDRLCVSHREAGGANGGTAVTAGTAGTAAAAAVAAADGGCFRTVAEGRARLEAFQGAAVGFLAPLSGAASAAAAETAAGTFDEAMAFLEGDVADTASAAVDADREALKEVAADIMIALGRLHASRQAAAEKQAADVAAVDAATAAPSPAACAAAAAASPAADAAAAETDNGVDGDDVGELVDDGGLSDEDSADFVDARSEPYEDDIWSGLAAAAQGDRAGILSPSRRGGRGDGGDGGEAADETPLGTPRGRQPPFSLARAAAARAADVPDPEGVGPPRATTAGTPDATPVAAPPPRAAAPPPAVARGARGACAGVPPLPPPPTPPAAATAGVATAAAAAAVVAATATRRATDALLADAFASAASDAERGDAPAGGGASAATARAVDRARAGGRPAEPSLASACGDGGWGAAPAGAPVVAAAALPLAGASPGASRPAAPATPQRWAAGTPESLAVGTRPSFAARTPQSSDRETPPSLAGRMSESSGVGGTPASVAAAETPESSAVAETPESSTVAATPESLAVAATPESLAVAATPGSSAAAETPGSSAAAETPESLAGAEIPPSSGGQTPESLTTVMPPSFAAKTPQSSVAETPQAAAAETPGSSAAAATPESSAVAATPESSAVAATPDTWAVAETPESSAVATTPESSAAVETPGMSAAAATPDSSAVAATQESLAAAETPQSSGGRTPESLTAVMPPWFDANTPQSSVAETPQSSATEAPQSSVVETPPSSVAATPPSLAAETPQSSSAETTQSSPSETPQSSVADAPPSSTAGTPQLLADNPSRVETPLSSAVETPLSSVGESPQLSVGESFQSLASKTPETSATKTPQSSVAETPQSLAATETPQRSGYETSESSVADTLQSSAAESPWSLTAKTPESSAAETPQSSASQTSRPSAAKTPQPEASQTPEAETPETSVASSPETPPRPVSESPAAVLPIPQGTSPGVDQPVPGESSPGVLAPAASAPVAGSADGVAGVGAAPNANTTLAPVAGPAEPSGERNAVVADVSVAAESERSPLPTSHGDSSAAASEAVINGTPEGATPADTAPAVVTAGPLVDAAVNDVAGTTAAPENDNGTPVPPGGGGASTPASASRRATPPGLCAAAPSDAVAELDALLAAGLRESSVDADGEEDLRADASSARVTSPSTRELLDALAQESAGLELLLREDDGDRGRAVNDVGTVDAAAPHRPDRVEQGAAGAGDDPQAPRAEPPAAGTKRPVVTFCAARMARAAAETDEFLNKALDDDDHDDAFDDAGVDSSDEEQSPPVSKNTAGMLQATAETDAFLEKALDDESGAHVDDTGVDSAAEDDHTAAAGAVAGARAPSAIDAVAEPSPDRSAAASETAKPVASPASAKQSPPLVTFCAARMEVAAAETDAFLNKALDDNDHDDAFDDAGVDSSDEDQPPPVSKNTAGMLQATAETDAFLEKALDDESGAHVDDTGVDSEAEEEQPADATASTVVAKEGASLSKAAVQDRAVVDVPAVKPDVSPAPAKQERPLVTFCAARMEVAAAETDVFLNKALDDDDHDDAFDDAGVDSSDEDQPPPVSKNTAGMLQATAETDAFLEKALDDESGAHVDDTGVDSEAEDEQPTAAAVAKARAPAAVDAASQPSPDRSAAASETAKPVASPASAKQSPPLVTFCAARMEVAAAETDAFLNKALDDNDHDDAFDDAGVDSSDEDQPPPVSKNTAGMLQATAETDAFLEKALDDESGAHVDDTGVDSEAESDQLAVTPGAVAPEDKVVGAAAVSASSPKPIAPSPPASADGTVEAKPGAESALVEKRAPLVTFCAARMDVAAAETDEFLNKALDDDDHDDAFDDAGVDSSDEEQSPPVSKNTAGMLQAAAETDAFLEKALDDESGAHVDDTGVDSEAEDEQPGAPAPAAGANAPTAARSAPVGKSPSDGDQVGAPELATRPAQAPRSAPVEEEDERFDAADIESDEDVSVLKNTAGMLQAAAGTGSLLTTALDDKCGAHVDDTDVDSEKKVASPNQLSSLSPSAAPSPGAASIPSRARAIPVPSGVAVASGGSNGGAASTDQAAIDMTDAAPPTGAFRDKALKKSTDEVDHIGIDSEAEGSQSENGEERECSMAAATAEADEFLAQALGDDGDANVDDTGVDSDADEGLDESASEDAQPEARERSMAAAAAEADAFLEMALGDDDGGNVDDTGVDSDAEQEVAQQADTSMVAAAAEANAFLERALGDDGGEDVDDTGVNSDTEQAADAAGASGNRGLRQTQADVEADGLVSNPSSGPPSSLNKLRGFAHSVAGGGELGSIAVAGALSGGVDIDTAKKKLGDLDVLLGGGGDDEDDAFDDFEAASSGEDEEQWAGARSAAPRSPVRGGSHSDASSSPLYGPQADPVAPAAIRSYGRRFGGGHEKTPGVPPATMSVTVWPPGDGGFQEHANVPVSGSILQSLSAGAIVELLPRTVVVDAIFVGMGGSSSGPSSWGSLTGGAANSADKKQNELMNVMVGITRSHIERLLNERNETTALLEVMINEHCKTAEQVVLFRSLVDLLAANKEECREQLPNHCGFSISAELAVLRETMGQTKANVSALVATAQEAQNLVKAEQDKAAAATASLADVQAAQEAAASRVAELEAAALEASEAPARESEETRQALEDAEATIDRLTTDVNRANNQRNAMRLQCRQTQAALDRMMASNNQERSKMQSRLLKLQRIADTAQYEVDRAVREVQHTADEAVTAKASAESELQTLLVTHGTMCRNFVELEEELLQLRKDHSALRQAQEMATAVARMNGENAKISMSQAELAAAEASDQSRKLAAQLQEARREATAARSEVESLRSCVSPGSDFDGGRPDGARSHVARLQADAHSLQTSLTAALQVSDKYKEQLRELQDRGEESERAALHARKQADMANRRLAGEDAVTKDEATAAALAEELALVKRQHQQRVSELESLLCTAETALSTSASERLTESRMTSMAATSGAEGGRPPRGGRRVDRVGEEPSFSGFGGDCSSSPASAASSGLVGGGDGGDPAELQHARNSIFSIPDVDVDSEDEDRSFGSSNRSGSYQGDRPPGKLPPVSRGQGPSMAFSPVSAAVAMPSLWRSRSVNMDFNNDVASSPSFRQRSASIFTQEESGSSPTLSPAPPEPAPPAPPAKPPVAAAPTPPPKGGRMFKRLGYKLRFNHN